MITSQTIMRVKQGVFDFLLLIFTLNVLILSFNTFIIYDLILKSILILNIKDSLMEKYSPTTSTFTIFSDERYHRVEVYGATPDF